MERGKGANTYLFPAGKRRKLLKSLRTAVEALDSERNFFAIEADGVIVTVVINIEDDFARLITQGTKMNSAFAQDTFNAATEIWRDWSATQDAPRNTLFHSNYHSKPRYSDRWIESRAL